ncbi:GTPase Era [BD1-7 clade bacterium]|uniref:GTPase Era n=1 Tax=BD1-7 clade bacterium TaxID=2029982 RepID=A0A5S9QDH7_9GAMM|nr:GTPase Era [BD1-7 clade bacterium]CAA0115941.1 GTPase Era [BD1-7 clade bacterium]
MTKQCGYVAVIGRPNVGKSTLINKILGQKLNITSRKPQTTRHNVLGIKTEDDYQAIYVDTPGMHLSQKKAINRMMNRSAESVVHDVDVIVFVVERLRWTEEDTLVLEKISNAKCPVVLAINKIDQIEDKSKLLPFLEEISAKRHFDEIIPLSAKTGHSVENLEMLINQRLPESGHFFDEDQLTDKSERFLAAEIVREKVMRQLGHELPYATTVEIEQFKAEGKIVHIDALIMVERDSQKSIVIGKQGSRLKMIGSEARHDIEDLLQCKVMLQLWVKVKRGWSDDDRALKSLGYMDE